MPRWGLAILLSLGTATQQVVCSVVTLHLVTPVTHVAMLQEQGEALLEPGTSGATNLTLEVAISPSWHYSQEPSTGLPESVDSVP